MQQLPCAALVVLIGCAGTAPPPAPPALEPAPQVVHVDLAVTVDEPAPVTIVPEGRRGPEVARDGEGHAASTASRVKDQPPHIKLKLGHYVNDDRGIGVTIDRTTRLDNVAALPPAKVRFDGASQIWILEGQPGPAGRIDYVRERGRVVLHVWEDGRTTVYVPDPDDGPASGPIQLRRDGDADPL